MAIKLVNALRNFHIENNEIETQKIISFLVNNRNYKESQIDISLIIQDIDYIELAEYLGHYEIRCELEAPIGFGSAQERDEYMELTFNRLIPNREPSQYTKYSDVAKKIISTDGNSEQIKTMTTNVTSESQVDGLTSNDNMNSIQWKWPENYYGINVSDENKNTFENYLYELCKGKKKRSLTKDVVDYLKFKESQNIIKRPEQINTEFDIIKRFGYPYKIGAYYKA